MLPTSIFATAVTAALCFGLFIVAAGKAEPGDRLGRALDALVPVVIIAFIGFFFVCIIEEGDDVKRERDREAAQVEAIEDRYDVKVTRSVFGEPGDWKIDDAWVRCFIPDEDAAPADVTLSCDPTSHTAEKYVDFADLDGRP